MEHEVPGHQAAHQMPIVDTEKENNLGRTLQPAPRCTTSLKTDAIDAFCRLLARRNPPIICLDSLAEDFASARLDSTSTASGSSRLPLYKSSVKARSYVVKVHDHEERDRESMDQMGQVFGHRLARQSRLVTERSTNGAHDILMTKAFVRRGCILFIGDVFKLSESPLDVVKCLPHRLHRTRIVIDTRIYHAEVIDGKVIGFESKECVSLSMAEKKLSALPRVTHIEPSVRFRAENTDTTFHITTADSDRCVLELNNKVLYDSISDDNRHEVNVSGGTDGKWSIGVGSVRVMADDGRGGVVAGNLVPIILLPRKEAAELQRYFSTAEEALPKRAENATDVRHELWLRVMLPLLTDFFVIFNCQSLDSAPTTGVVRIVVDRVLTFLEEENLTLCAAFMRKYCGTQCTRRSCKKSADEKMGLFRNRLTSVAHSSMSRKSPRVGGVLTPLLNVYEKSAMANHQPKTAKCTPNGCRFSTNGRQECMTN